MMSECAGQGYHLEHHKYMGEDGVDVDLPTNLELICLNNVLGKVFFWQVSALYQPYIR